MTEKKKKVLADCEKDEYIADFIKNNEKAIDFSKELKLVQDFLKKHNGKKVVFVSSGRMVAPLEQNMVRYVSNFSSGTRGARSTEEFLKGGYAVIFYHHLSARQPFDLNKVNVADLSVEKDQVFISNVEKAKEYVDNVKFFKKYQDCLLKLKFHTVVQYMMGMYFILKAMKSCGKKGMFYSAAAVSDFYIPYEKMCEHKIQSRGNAGLTIEMDNTPKMLKPIKFQWCPELYLVSFKLETDRSIIEKKVGSAMDKYKMNCVVANLLQTNKKEVFLNHSDKVEHVKLEEGEKIPIEAKFIKVITKLHEEYCK